MNLHDELRLIILNVTGVTLFYTIILPFRFCRLSRFLSIILDLSIVILQICLYDLYKNSCGFGARIFLKKISYSENYNYLCLSLK